MKRWNGWGKTSTHMELPSQAQVLLVERVGTSTCPKDREMAFHLARIGKAETSPCPNLSTDPMQRLLHARGQSLPDWVDLRQGQIDRVPDGVAVPNTETELIEILEQARKRRIAVIPYGGGTSVVGHLTPCADRAVWTLSLARLNRTLSIDTKNRLATFAAGIRGPHLESSLRARGYTLGHFPQSFEYSTLGGWIAARSSGQQSLRYGRIEDLYAGGTIWTPEGPLEIPTLPASAAGPDLRQLVLGSEGRMGVVLKATVRIRPLPEAEHFEAMFFPTWDQAVEAIRGVAQAEPGISMLRLSNPVETLTNLMLAGSKASYLRGYLGFRRIDARGCMCLIGYSGDRASIRVAKNTVSRICSGSKGQLIGSLIGRAWEGNRFKAPYLRNTLWSLGYAVDTLETAIPWSRLTTTMTGIEHAITAAFDATNERVHVFSHVSHVYASGASLYTTYVFRVGANAEETKARWKAAKAGASQAIVQAGGTISHQHGVGLDHKPYLVQEKGELGLGALKQLYRHFDPTQIMNPDKQL